MSHYYISVDVETTGLSPGVSSMISLGAAVYTSKGNLVRTFERNLEELEGGPRDPDTMAWWEKHPEQWRKSRESALPVKKVMEEFADVLRTLQGVPIVIGWPVSFDVAFIDYYLQRFTVDRPRGRYTCCIKSMLSLHLGTPLHMVDRNKLPEHLTPIPLEKHVALNDAMWQADVFFRLTEGKS